jgi:hypothetical protein
MSVTPAPRLKKMFPSKRHAAAQDRKRMPETLSKEAAALKKKRRFLLAIRLQPPYFRRALAQNMIRLVLQFVLIAAISGLIQPSFASNPAEEIIYDNTAGFFGTYASELTEYGDQVDLGGTARTLTQVDFECFANITPMVAKR